MSDLKKSQITSFFSGTFTIFFTAFLAIIFLTIWFFWHLIDIEKYKIQTAMEMESIRLERQFVDRIEHTFALIKNMDEQIAKNPQSKNHINQILERFKSSPELSDSFSWTIFSWANAQNQITVDAQYGIMKQPFDLSGRDYIPLTKSAPEKFHLGSPVFGSTSKKWMIPGGVGVVDQNGKYLGAMTMGFEIESLSRSLHKVLQNYNIGFELLSDKGTPILHANNCSFGFSEVAAIENPLVKSLLEKSKTAKIGSVSDIKLFKNKHGFLVKKLNDFPYFFILKYDDRAIRNEMWQALISRSVEISLLFFISSFLLILIYKKEQHHRQRILIMKRLVEKTNEAKMEFIAKSANELQSFVVKIQSSAKAIRSDLEKHAQQTQNIKLSRDIIADSAHLAEFMNNLIELNQSENIEIQIDADDHEADIMKVVKRSVKLLQAIADKSDSTLIDKIEDTLHQLSAIEPKRVKQIIINLAPSGVKQRDQEVKLSVHNDNDE